MKTLVMCLADPSGNPRPYRIINLLNSQRHSVDVLCYTLSGELPIQNHFVIPNPSWYFRVSGLRTLLGMLGSIVVRVSSRLQRYAYRINDLRYGLLAHEAELSSRNYDLIVVEDLQMLPLAFRVKKKAKVLFDAREYYTKQNEESLRFRALESPLRSSLSREYLSRCDQLITVSPGLANAYAQEFRVSMTVIRSTPNFMDLPVRPTMVNEIRMVHHGMASRNRNIQNMIEIVQRLDDRFTLDLYLVGSPQYIKELRSCAGGCVRIQFRTPVRFNEIIPMLNGYDLGLYYLEPVGFNVSFNLPNKIFEFIQARLAIAIGPSPNMSDLVFKYDLGFVAKEFTITSMVNTLQSLTVEQIDLAKRNSAQAASELCYERESENMLRMLHRFQFGE